MVLFSQYSEWLGRRCSWTSVGPVIKSRGHRIFEKPQTNQNPCCSTVFIMGTSRNRRLANEETQKTSKMSSNDIQKWGWLHTNYAVLVRFTRHINGSTAVKPRIASINDLLALTLHELRCFVTFHKGQQLSKRCKTTNPFDKNKMASASILALTWAGMPTKNGQNPHSRRSFVRGNPQITMIVDRSIDR